MRKEKQETKKTPKRRHRWLWFLFFVLLLAGAAWYLYDSGKINVDFIKKTTLQDAAVEQVVVESVETEASGLYDVEEVSVNEAEVQLAGQQPDFQPACKVVEELLLKRIVADDVDDYRAQYYSANIYKLLSERGCPDNSKYFEDMAMRKRRIADVLKESYNFDTDNMKDVKYLYSEEKVCQTIENRVLKNINTKANSYDEFLENANTYAALYQYGCCDNKAAYMRAALRELGVAVALMPTDKMTRGEILTVVEICKSLGVADVAHLMVQRLKARGYDMEFLQQMEDIIHSIR